MNTRSIILFVLLLSLSALGWWFAGKPLQQYLSLNKPLPDADFLIVEGWLNPQELDFVAEHFSDNDYEYVITTGFPIDPDVLLFKNGTYQLFLDHAVPAGQLIDLEVQLYGSLPAKYASVFKVYANTRLIAYDSVGDKSTIFSYRFHFEETLKSISIQYTNDAMVDGKDRNLSLSMIRLNGRRLSLLESRALYSIETIDDSTVYYLAANQARFTKKMLVDRGVYENRIIEFSSEKQGISKTLTSAKNTIQTFDSLAKEPDYTFNIISVYPHTRRTYISYSRFHPAHLVGVIAVPGSYIEDYQSNRMKNIRELIGIITVILYPGS